MKLKLGITLDLSKFCHLLLLAISFLPFSAANGASEGLKIMSTSMSDSAAFVIVGDVTLSKWVTCWAMDSKGVPIANGDAFVKGKFVKVMILKNEHFDRVSSFYCEYQN